MNRFHELAQLLVSCWSLSGKDSKLPTSPQGRLDSALRLALERGALPQWARDSLHFTESRVGLKCVELPSILDWAQTAELTSEPNPSYSAADARGGDEVALFLLSRLNVSPEEAVKWGKTLRNAIDELSKADRTPVEENAVH